MDTLLAIAGDGFVVVAADAQVARSILLYQRDLDKIKPLDATKLLASAGPQADCVAFTEYIQKNMALYELNNDLTLTTNAAAHFIRGELAYALRRGPYQTSLLLGGIDGDSASLYWMDYLGTLQKVDYGAHGYGSNFTLSVIDRDYKKGLSEEDAVGIVRKCIHELQTRFLISQTNFTIKVLNKKDGVKVLE